MRRVSSVGLATAVALVLALSASSDVADQFYMDSRDDAAVYSTAVLAAGQQYLVTVEGTFSVWEAWVWDPPACRGTPEDAPWYPSPGVTNGKVGCDVAYFFAVKDPSPLCNEAAYPDMPFAHARLSIDTGSGWSDRFTTRPDDDTYNSGHVYQYTVLGEDQTLGLHFYDNPYTDNYGQLLVTIETTSIAVDIDIKPGSWPNSFKIDGNGVVPLAILGSDTFDVMQIDVSSLSFAGLSVRVKGNGLPQCSVQDVSGADMPYGEPDGFEDLVCQFVDDPSMWSPDDGTATVTGLLLNGTPFTGVDYINLK